MSGHYARQVSWTQENSSKIIQNKAQIYHKICFIVIWKWTFRIKGHSQLWDRADLDTSFSHFEKSSPQPEKVHLHVEFHFNLHSVLLN